MRKAIGVALIVAGVLAGLYVGVYLMLIGGITQLVNAIQQDPVRGADVGWGAARVTLAFITGAVTAVAIGFFGAAIADGPVTQRGLRKRNAKRRERIQANRRGVV